MRPIIFGNHPESRHERFLLCRESHWPLDADNRWRGPHGFVYEFISEQAKQAARLRGRLDSECHHRPSAGGRASAERIFRGSTSRVRSTTAHGGHRVSAARVARADKNTLW